MAQRLEKRERLALINSIAKFGEHSEDISFIRKQVSLDLNKVYDFNFIKYYYNKVFKARWLKKLEEDNLQMKEWKKEYECKPSNTPNESKAEELFNQFTGLTVDY